MSADAPTHNRRWIVYLVLLLAVFLAGFTPQWMRASRAEQELTQVRRELDLARARDLAGTLFLEVSRNNFGTAAGHAAQFFDQVRSLTDNPEFASHKATLDKIAADRDAVTAGLAKADAGVRQNVQQIASDIYALK